MKKFLKGAMLSLGAIAMLGAGSLAYATEYDAGDISAPRGRLYTEDAIKLNNINYITGDEITFKVYAYDDISDEIWYYVSTSAIDTTKEITGWKLYEDGITETVTLPDRTSTYTVYAVFKDKSGNISITFSSSLSHEIVYHTNADGDDTAVDVTGVCTSATYGEPFIITSVRPERYGYYFLRLEYKSKCNNTKLYWWRCASV